MSSFADSDFELEVTTFHAQGFLTEPDNGKYHQFTILGELQRFVLATNNHSSDYLVMVAYSLTKPSDYQRSENHQKYQLVVSTTADAEAGWIYQQEFLWQDQTRYVTIYRLGAISEEEFRQWLKGLDPDGETCEGCTDQEIMGTSENEPPNLPLLEYGLGLRSFV